MLIPVIKRVRSLFVQKYYNLEMFEINPEFSHHICWQKSMQGGANARAVCCKKHLKPVLLSLYRLHFMEADYIIILFFWYNTFHTSDVC